MLETILNLNSLQIFLLANNLIICIVALISIFKSFKMKYKRRYWVVSLYYAIVILLNSGFVVGCSYFINSN
jgi:hypothetical protein